MVTPTPEMCLACKGGKNLCGEPCILLARIDNRLPRLRLTQQEFQGPSPPAVFVGRWGYPRLNVGPLVPPLALDHAAAAGLQDPARWVAGSIQDVLGMRSSLVRTHAQVRVGDARRPPPLLSTAQELIMAERPVETEVHLVKKPNLALSASVSDVTTPMGPSVEADRARLVENPHVPRRVDALVDDRDARASTAMRELAANGLPGYRIEPLLSLGMLGRATERRLVPTRWSITAVDDTLGLAAIPHVQEQPVLDQVEYYPGTLHGNDFHVVLLPRPWAFDMIETWMKGAIWALETSPFTMDWEDGRGRSSYASHVGGAYYAARLAALEHLRARGRQASVLVYREITPEYWAPLGVWVIREGVRAALAQEPIAFETVESALAHAEARTRRHGWGRASKLLGDARSQRRIHEF